MSQVAFTVHGLPAPQGSKKGFVNPKTGRVIVKDDNRRTKPWRQAVKADALDALDGATGFAGAVEVSLRFMLPRPKGHYGTGRNAGRLKPSAPAFPAVRPDLDKLERSTLDGLTDAGVFSDDARVVTLRSVKRYLSRPEAAPRCDVVVREAPAVAYGADAFSFGGEAVE